jgi:membrane-associated phospholipid phosphatase
MALGKTFFYDWGGANEALFKSINSMSTGGWYDALMILLSRTADHENFPYIILLLLFCTFLDYGMRKLRARGGATHSLIAWFGVFCVLTASYWVAGGSVRLMKSHFELPRPYVAIGPEDVKLLEFRTDPADDYRSFPSGHASFITLLVVSIWPVLSSGMRKFALLLIFGVCWSRIAVGMHFPADVIGGALISLTVTFLLRWIIYLQLLKLKLKC